MKNILITGGTGSFGKEFVKRILTTKIERVCIYSRGEHAQDEMERELNDPRLRFFIGDVRDVDRLEMAMRGVDSVIHAAALKIVPVLEYNPTECIDTNIGGAKNVVKAALWAGVERVVSLSTDKAVNPVNLYGTSKLAAEKIFVAAGALAAGSCRFSSVRYGNVVGSRGSVIPLFRQQIKQGKPLTITDARMTRFWITMERAIDMVLVALRADEGRCIYVPKIPSMKIIDLARTMAPVGYPIDYVGIRPGEKLHECLLTEDEARFTTECDQYYVIRPTGPPVLGIPWDFRYTSDGNDAWIEPALMAGVL
jgi:UDP-N-acetylglucosamine 4,6-dehydratase